MRGRGSWIWRALLVLCGFFVQVQALPIGVSCAEKDSATQSLMVRSVTPIKDGLIVKLALVGTTGVKPEFAIVVISSSSLPGLEVIVESGKKGMRMGQSRVVPFNKLDTSGIVFLGLDSSATYYVHVAGYRCEATGVNSTAKYLTPWKTKIADGERAIYWPHGGDGHCRDPKPIVERIDLTKSNGGGALGSLFHVRMMNCDDKGLAEAYTGTIRDATTYSDFGFSIERDTTKPLFLSVKQNYSTKLNGLLEEVLGADRDGSGRLFGYLRNNVGSTTAGTKKWLEVYFFLSGDRGGIDFAFHGTGAKVTGDFYASVPKQGVTWVDEASKKLAGMLDSDRGAVIPKGAPAEGDEGTKMRVLSAIAINQLGLTGKDGSDMLAYMPEMWSFLRDKPDALNRISLVLNDTTSKTLLYRLKRGVSLSVYPEFNASDALVSQSGWVKIADNPFQGVSDLGRIKIRASENVALYAKTAGGVFYPLQAGATTAVESGLRAYAIELSSVPAGSSDTIGVLLQKCGLWVRAEAHSGIQNVSSSNIEVAESFLVEMCSNPMACNRIRGGVDRSSILTEVIIGDSLGLRRGNAAEMLPGETRNYTLRSNLSFPSSWSAKTIQATNCSPALDSCPFSATMAVASRQRFSVSAGRTATPSTGRFQLDLSETPPQGKKAPSAFVLDMQARIFGTTSLVLIGPDDDRNSSTILRYEKAGNTFTSYLQSLGGTQNIQTINCRTGMNGSQAFNCTSPALAGEIHRYASYPLANRVNGLYWFGHGYENGYPALLNGTSWLPEYSVPSFADNAVFASFACNGGVDTGLKAFGAAFGTKLIGNVLYTGLVALRLETVSGRWEAVYTDKLIAGDDIVMVSKLDTFTVKPKSPGGRRTLDWRVPYNFVLAIPHINSATGEITLDKSPYALEDFPLFRQNSTLNFPKH